MRYAGAPGLLGRALGRPERSDAITPVQLAWFARFTLLSSSLALLFDLGLIGLLRQDARVDEDVLWTFAAINLPLLALLGPAAAPPPPAAAASPPRDGQRDFDFEIGTWNTHLRRRLRPLTGSTTWVEYRGTTVVRKVWNGRANLVELDVSGPAGAILALSLRLYDPRSGEWSLNFANSAVGAMTPPVVGRFVDGRGEFRSSETLDGRPILVRFVISDITTSSCRFEQFFSDDNGKTWELNWVAIDTRIEDSAAAR